jgi:hypothetical protein
MSVDRCDDRHSGAKSAWSGAQAIHFMAAALSNRSNHGAISTEVSVDLSADRHLTESLSSRGRTLLGPIAMRSGKLALEASWPPGAENLVAACDELREDPRRSRRWAEMRALDGLCQNADEVQRNAQQRLRTPPARRQPDDPRARSHSKVTMRARKSPAPKLLGAPFRGAPLQARCPCATRLAQRDVAQCCVPPPSLVCRRGRF